jgi:hypothetical protein
MSGSSSSGATPIVEDPVQARARLKDRDRCLGNKGSSPLSSIRFLTPRAASPDASFTQIS